MRGVYDVYGVAEQYGGIKEVIAVCGKGDPLAIEGEAREIGRVQWMPCMEGGVGCRSSWTCFWS